MKHKVFSIFSLLLSNLVPRIKVWRKAMVNFNKSEDALCDILNDNQLLTLQGQQVLNDNTYWKLVLYTEQIKVITWLLFLLGLFIAEKFDIMIYSAFLLACLITFFWFSHDVRLTSP